MEAGNNKAYRASKTPARKPKKGKVAKQENSSQVNTKQSTLDRGQPKGNAEISETEEDEAEREVQALADLCAHHISIFITMFKC